MKRGYLILSLLLFLLFLNLGSPWAADEDESSDYRDLFQLFLSYVKNEIPEEDALAKLEEFYQDQRMKEIIEQLYRLFSQIDALPSSDEDTLTAPAVVYTPLGQSPAVKIAELLNKFFQQVVKSEDIDGMKGIPLNEIVKSKDAQSDSSKDKRKGKKLPPKKILKPDWGDIAEKIADKISNPPKKRKLSPTVTGRVSKENSQYYMQVDVWTGVGDPNNIHVTKEFWDSLSEEKRQEISDKAEEHGGKVIIEGSPIRIKLDLKLSEEDKKFVDQHLGERITLHGWTEDGLIKDGDTLETVGLSTWFYEPQHPFDLIVKEEELQSEDEETEEEVLKQKEKVYSISSPGYSVYQIYPLLKGR